NTKKKVQTCSKKSKLLVEIFKNTTQQSSTEVSQQVVMPNLENHTIVGTNQFKSQEFAEKFNIACQHVLNILKH
ncbi:6389_t:CDS:1, partial [Gigaspora margarita]